jgi:hypothetical protein
MGTPARALSLRDFLPETARRTGLEGGDAFDALADAIADTAARNLPVISASAGFTYRYNPALEVFERTSETLGPLFLERPDTLGRGKLNVNISYQYVELDEYDGDDMGSLQAPDPIVARVVNAQGELLGFTANDLRYNLQLINHVIGLSATYGILDNLDVNLLVPLISTDYDVTATTTRRFAAEPGGPFLVAPAPPRTSTLTDSVFGVGDIFLRGKYQLPRAGGMRSAAGLQFRLPSGDVDDFQGTGVFEISPFFYASTVLWTRVEPHANLGIDIRTDDAARSQGRYGVGVDVDITRRIGAAIDFLGRSEFKRSSPPGETSFLHLTSAGPQLRPLLGAEFDRKDFFDLSFGARGVVWRQIMVFVNGIYALNDDGLRSSEIIPTIGVEGTF